MSERGDHRPTDAEAALLLSATQDTNGAAGELGGAIGGGFPGAAVRGTAWEGLIKQLFAARAVDRVVDRLSRL